MSSGNQYLQKRYQTYYCVVEVPRQLRAKVGKRRFVRSLKTQSLEEARRKRWLVLPQFMKVIQDATEGPGFTDQETLNVALEFREHYLKASDDIPPSNGEEVWSQREFVESTIGDEARLLADSEGEASATRFFEIATGKGVLVSDTLDKWLEEEASNLTNQTAQLYRKSVELFLNWAGPDTLTNEVDRLAAGKFVSERLRKMSLAPATINRHVTALSSLWRWMERKGYVEHNPWHRQSVSQKQDDREERRPLTEDEIVLLLSTHSKSKHDGTIHDLVRLALFTGARLGELCDLTRADILCEPDGLWIDIKRGKTNAAKRRIPVHPIIKHIAERRVQDTDDDLFSGLTPGGMNNKKSHNVSKAFNKFRMRAGVTGRYRDFHALRSTFMAKLQAAEVPLDTIQALVGHQAAPLAYQAYARSAYVKTRAAIMKLEYRKDVLDLIGQHSD